MNPLVLQALLSAFAQQRAGERQAMPVGPRWSDKMGAWAANNYPADIAQQIARLAEAWANKRSGEMWNQPPTDRRMGLNSMDLGGMPDYPVSVPMLPPNYPQPQQDLYSWMLNPPSIFAMKAPGSVNPHFAEIHGDM